MPRFDVQRLSILAGWAALAFIAYATLSPIKDRPVIAGLQFEHFAAFALLGLAFALGYPRRTVLIVGIVIGSAFTLEALQLLTPDRHGRLVDALVKAAGGLSGIGVTRLGLPILVARFSRIKTTP
jgi:VanZ family protein